MDAAGVEPGGRLVIEHADGWPLGRLRGGPTYFAIAKESTP